MPIFYNAIFTFHFNKPANLIYKLNSQYLLKAFCVGCEEEGIIRFAMASVEYRVKVTTVRVIKFFSSESSCEFLVFNSAFGTQSNLINTEHNIIN